jgi:hypothetical protein
MQTASDLQRHGAFCFGLVVGWNLYFLNRYRKDVALADLGTLIAAIGGGAVLALFPAKTDLFGAYGVGLAVGFFGYFLLVVILALLSKNFGVDYLIDGRRKRLGPDEERSPTPDRPMEATDTTLPPGT